MQDHGIRALGGTALLLGLVAMPASAQGTKRASVSTAGVEGNAASLHPSIDRGGRFVAFDSDADNLVAVDGNVAKDVFLRDRGTGRTYLVSRNNGGAQGNARSESPHLSALADFVAFQSEADNLVPGDVNALSDIFLRDLLGGATMRVSWNFGGGQTDGPSYQPFVNANGRFVAFSSDATNVVPGDVNGLRDVFLTDLGVGLTVCLSIDGAGTVNANGNSNEPSLSADASIAVFGSDADNLVPGDMNGATDIFVHEVATGNTRRISVGMGGVESDGMSFDPWISEDGAFIVYESDATNLVAGDVNGQSDVFVFERATQTTTLVSTATDGTPGDGWSGQTMISSTGRFIGFQSAATTLVPGDMNGATDIFVHDQDLAVTYRVNLGDGFMESAGWSHGGAISGDGRTFAWFSDASDQVAGDANGCDDVFVRDAILAEWGNYGVGHPGTLGIPDLTLSADPVIGTTPNLEIDNSALAATVGVVFGGFSAAILPTTWDSDLLVVPFIVLPMALPIGMTSLPLAIPQDEMIEGLEFFLQVLELDSGASDGISFTPGLRLACGW